jgi:leucyl/phenylalanyl-tRNA--protein transferase
VSSLQLPRLGRAADAPFPPTARALKRPNGLLAWGGDLRSERLLAAYRQGIFPWYSEGEPILWWTPDPRCVLLPAEVRLSRRTLRRYNSGIYRLSADTAFGAVIDGCAAPRREEGGTWITPALRTAFTRLHAAGHAHSIEVWQGQELVGGIYGLALGRIFFGESMFSREVDASKIALVALCRLLAGWSFALLDCQVTNPHLLSMGAIEMPRAEFERQLREAVGLPGQTGSWSGRFTPEARW